MRYKELLLLIFLLLASILVNAEEVDSLPWIAFAEPCQTLGEIVTLSSREDDFGNRMVFKFVVSPDGTAETVDIVSRTGSDRVARLARRYLQRCRYKPAQRDGVPVQGNFKWILDIVSVANIQGPNKSKCPIPSARAEIPVGVRIFTKVKLMFSPAGKVLRADVAESSGNEALDAQAVDALSRCVFDPSALEPGKFQETAYHIINWLR